MTQVPPEGEPFGGSLPTPPYPPVLPGLLDSVARSQIIVGGLTVGFRRALEFVAGSTGTVITAVDDPVNEKVTVTITASAQQAVGDIKESLQTADHGSWLLCQGGTFSGATWPGLQTLLGGTTLPDFRGRSPMGSGTGAGLTARTLKLTYGAETHVQTLAEIAQHSHDEGAHTHLAGTHSHGLNSHTHGLNSHTHALESHTHGVDSGSAFFSTADNGAFDLALAAHNGGAHYKNTTTQTMTPAFFGGASAPDNDTTLGPATGTGTGKSTNTDTATTLNSYVAGALNTTGTPQTGTTPSSPATGMPTVHPVYVVNFFIFAT